MWNSFFRWNSEINVFQPTLWSMAILPHVHLKLRVTNSLQTYERLIARINICLLLFRLDQQSQLLQAQQQLFQHQLQLNNEETAMQLLQHNLMQARMSPSYGSIQQQVSIPSALAQHNLSLHHSSSRNGPQWPSKRQVTSTLCSSDKAYFHGLINP